MIDREFYVAFVVLTLGLIASPGPNVMLIVSNSLAHGAGRGLLTVAGTSSALIIQLLVAAFGVASVTLLLADLFEWLRWAGVIYLVYLGIQQFRRTGAAEKQPPARSVRATYLQGFAVALTNPKTMLFFVAFLPQFVVEQRPVTPQLLTLCVTFLVLATIGDGLFALLAARLRGLGRSRWRSRATGALYLTAGLGLALARR